MFSLSFVIPKAFDNSRFVFFFSTGNCTVLCSSNSYCNLSTVQWVPLLFVGIIVGMYQNGLLFSLLVSNLGFWVLFGFGEQSIEEEIGF